MWSNPDLKGPVRTSCDVNWFVRETLPPYGPFQVQGQNRRNCFCRSLIKLEWNGTIGFPKPYLLNVGWHNILESVVNFAQGFHNREYQWISQCMCKIQYFELSFNVYFRCLYSMVDEFVSLSWWLMSLTWLWTNPQKSAEMTGNDSFYLLQYLELEKDSLD